MGSMNSGAVWRAGGSGWGGVLLSFWNISSTGPWMSSRWRLRNGIPSSISQPATGHETRRWEHSLYLWSNKFSQITDISHNSHVTVLRGHDLALCSRSAKTLTFSLHWVQSTSLPRHEFNLCSGSSDFAISVRPQSLHLTLLAGQYFSRWFFRSDLHIFSVPHNSQVVFIAPISRLIAIFGVAWKGELRQVGQLERFSEQVTQNSWWQQVVAMASSQISRQIGQRRCSCSSSDRLWAARNRVSLVRNRSLIRKAKVNSLKQLVVRACCLITS